jgi:ATP-dependent DNA helicase RecQ
VLPYAGLPPEVRAANQAAFVASEDMVMVATVAFGMGIDKPDVRFVAHAALPKSIEGYYQETGRAGRDGDPSVALLLGADDFLRARQRIGEVEEHRRASERQRLDAMAGLVEAGGCRRAVLLRHFGEDPPPTCGNCDNCLSPPAQTDATELARKFLSAVYRTGQSFGFGHIEKVLTGRADERVTRAGTISYRSSASCRRRTRRCCACCRGPCRRAAALSPPSMAGWRWAATRAKS